MHYFRWENLQLILEVYQFARDAAVAEAWLIAQEPYLLSQELGQTIDDVENLIKKHEAFEKSAAAQEERFSALERLTTVICFIFLYVCLLEWSLHLLQCCCFFKFSGIIDETRVYLFINF